eukprot:COSAG01_NODE_13340_length_1598_cov_12.995997_1_plen_154_part_10
MRVPPGPISYSELLCEQHHKLKFDPGRRWRTNEFFGEQLSLITRQQWRYLQTTYDSSELSEGLAWWPEFMADASGSSADQDQRAPSRRSRSSSQRMRPKQAGITQAAADPPNNDASELAVPLDSVRCELCQECIQIRRQEEDEKERNYQDNMLQ